MLSRIHFFIILIFILQIESYSPGQDTPAKNEYSPENIAHFTRFLISKKEYYRAHIELNRLNTYYPGYLKPLEFSITESYLLFHGAQYKDLISGCASKDGVSAMSCSVFRFDSHLAIADDASLDTVLSSWIPGRYNDFDRYMVKRKFITSLFSRRFGDAEDILKKFPGNKISFDTVKYYREKYEQLKNPYCAAALGIIPGMGYVYAGNPRTGITAFLVIAMNAALAYFSFYTGNQALGVFIGAVGTFFYTGSIAGGYLAASKYNSVVMKSARERVIDDLELAQDREEIFSAYGIKSGR